MGEARRRMERFADGRPWLRKPRCPACGSTEMLEIPRGTLGSERAREAFKQHDCDLEACRSCKAVWESFPRVMVEDPVCAEPCDNCAFRPGSPEQQDPGKWRTLIEAASWKPEEWFGGGGRFYCHKGVPIDLAKQEFKFPRRPDGQYDVARMRVCSGWLRMIWAQRRKVQREAPARLGEFLARHLGELDGVDRWEDDGGAVG